MIRAALAALLPILLVLSCSSGPPTLTPGPWRAWLESPGGALPFHLEIQNSGGTLTARIRNGDQVETISRVIWEKGAFTFFLDDYDASLEGTPNKDGTRLEGRWKRRWGVDEFIGLPFKAVAGDAPRFEPEPPSDQPTLAESIDGRWTAYFEHRQGQHSVGVFETRDDGSVHGTFLNASGDYRFLEGVFENDHLRLSRFDGAHSFLVDLRLKDENTLEGKFFEADYLSTRVIAKRDPDAQLINTFELFEVTGDVELAKTRLVGLDGQDCDLAEDQFAGKVIVIDIFGTWCPNCHDATEFLSELYTRYRNQGLSVVGIGFEFSKDLARNLEKVRDYVEKRQVSYPMTLAFRDEVRSPTEVFPTIQGNYAFPTILFLYGDGRVKAVHSGFTSSAAREDHLVLRSKFERLVQEMLSEEG